MSFRQIEVPPFGRRLSNIMAAPSSAAPETHEAGLDEYRRLGGNALHLHGEGGETHSRQVAGAWLRRHGLRGEFFVCTQICHDAWDEASQKPLDRFTAEAVAEDVAADLDLLGAEYLDLVYLDDSADLPVEPLIDVLGREIALGRVRAFGVRNWAPRRIRAANSYAARTGQPGVSAVLTTELALAAANQPLWPEYLPFDAAVQQLVSEAGLAVLAHAGGLNLGQCLFGDEDTQAGTRPEWVQRWQHPANRALVERVRGFATAHGLTPRAVNIAYVLSQPFPVIGIVGLPALLSARRGEYERASASVLGEEERRVLAGIPE